MSPPKIQNAKTHLNASNLGGIGTWAFAAVLVSEGRSFLIFCQVWRLRYLSLQYTSNSCLKRLLDSERISYAILHLTSGNGINSLVSIDLPKNMFDLRDTDVSNCAVVIVESESADA